MPQTSESSGSADRKMQLEAVGTAITANDLDRLAQLLCETPDLARESKPLMDACFGGRFQAVSLLLEYGADANIVSETAHRHRPLHRTVEHQLHAPKSPSHLKVAKLLLDAGADVMATGSYYQVNAIALAAIGGETQFLPLLLSALSTWDIFTASVMGDVKRVTEILAANPTAASTLDTNGMDALMYCAASRLHYHNPKMASQLLEVAQILVAHGADPKRVYTSHGWQMTALYYAAGQSDHPAMTQFLIDQGADPTDHEALCHAAEHGYLRCLQILADGGADFNELVARSHETPLFTNLRWGRTSSVPWLLEHGADPNIRCGAHNRTCLYAAVMSNCKDKILQLLIDFGADLNATDDDGITPLAIALEKRYMRVAALLRKNGAIG